MGGDASDICPRLHPLLWEDRELRGVVAQRKSAPPCPQSPHGSSDMIVAGGTSVTRGREDEGAPSVRCFIARTLVLISSAGTCPGPSTMACTPAPAPFSPALPA